MLRVLWTPPAERDLRRLASKAQQRIVDARDLAEGWGVLPEGTNPCRYVDKYPERRRERFLSGAELARLGEVLAAAEQSGAEPPPVIAVIRLLASLGMPA